LTPDDDVARAWNDNADRWAQELAAGQDRYRDLFLDPAFAAFVGDVAGKRVLDAACGEGTSARRLAAAGARVVGVDLAQRMIDLAVERERTAPLGITYRQASLDDLSAFETGAFDVVTCQMALMDLGPLDASLAECRRVLRSGGTLAVAIAHPVSFTPRMQAGVDTRGRPVLTMAEYFAGWSGTTRWSFAGSDLERQGVAAFTVVRYHRTVSDYVNALLGAGFGLTGFAEPRPGEAACQELPRLAFWRDHAPLYLFLAGTKR
jgi:2-polyprenyl-3-methyl-5-hydroxy-6-metoxy-1,4-benzoquinol methylase